MTEHRLKAGASEKGHKEGAMHKAATRFVKDDWRKEKKKFQEHHFTFGLSFFSLSLSLCHSLLRKCVCMCVLNESYICIDT